MNLCVCVYDMSPSHLCGCADKFINDTLSTTILMLGMIFEQRKTCVLRSFHIDLINFKSEQKKIMCQTKPQTNKPQVTKHHDGRKSTMPQSTLSKFIFFKCPNQIQHLLLLWIHIYFFSLHHFCSGCWICFCLFQFVFKNSSFDDLRKNQN